ncbi:polyprenol monophosphomannose synthase [Nocardioides ginsengisoli]|uniref:Glycosyltransferase n=1 Tax=Nocardioides ginsengisoli TaxID=363868 RepID=A0ABW3VUK1_9ACTN
MNTTARGLLVVPTYDESATVPVLLDRIAAIRAATATRRGVLLDVLVVDDGSPDGTADVVREHPGHPTWIRLLEREGKGGLGSAYRAGFAWAVRHRYDIVVQLDADGSHPVETIPPMLALLRDNDLVVGSRYVSGGATENWPARRRALSWAANLYARQTLRLRTRDTTSGFRAWRVDGLLECGVLDTESNGYGFQVENTWHAERLGLRVAEHPITFTERTAGASKMSADVAREAVVLIARWRMAEIRERNARSARSLRSA